MRQLDTREHGPPPCEVRYHAHVRLAIEEAVPLPVRRDQVDTAVGAGWVDGDVADVDPVRGELVGEEPAEYVIADVAQERSAVAEPGEAPGAEPAGLPDTIEVLGVVGLVVELEWAGEMHVRVNAGVADDHHLERLQYLDHRPSLVMRDHTHVESAEFGSGAALPGGSRWRGRRWRASRPDGETALHVEEVQAGGRHGEVDRLGQLDEGAGLNSATQTVEV